MPQDRAVAIARRARPSGRSSFTATTTARLATVASMPFRYRRSYGHSERYERTWIRPVIIRVLMLSAAEIAAPIIPKRGISTEQRMTFATYVVADVISHARWWPVITRIFAME